MKTTLLAALLCLLAIPAHAETNQEALDAAYEWVEQESARQESRQAARRQQAALEDIRWEITEQRRQAQEHATAQAQEQARLRRLVEQQQQIERNRLAMEAWLRQRRCR